MTSNQTSADFCRCSCYSQSRLVCLCSIEQTPSQHPQIQISVQSADIPQNCCLLQSVLPLLLIESERSVCGRERDDPLTVHRLLQLICIATPTSCAYLLPPLHLICIDTPPPHAVSHIYEGRHRLIQEITEYLISNREMLIPLCSLSSAAVCVFRSS